MRALQPSLMDRSLGGARYPPVPLARPAAPLIRRVRAPSHRQAVVVTTNVTKQELASGRLYRPSATVLRNIEPYSLLSKAALSTMIKMLVCKIIPKGTVVSTKGEEPHEASILVSGVMVSLDGVKELEFGELINARECILKIPSQRSLVTESDCVVWQMSQERVQQLAGMFPEVGVLSARRMAQEMENITTKKLEIKAREAALRPYLTAAPPRGIVGNSKYAKRLRKDVYIASKDNMRGPVMIFGEPGLEKDRLAAMIHYGSVDFRTPMVKVDCGRYSSAVGSDLELELFGRGAKKGLLEWLEYGTLLINNVHLAPPELLTRILALLEASPVDPQETIIQQINTAGANAKAAKQGNNAASSTTTTTTTTKGTTPPTSNNKGTSNTPPKGDTSNTTPKRAPYAVRVLLTTEESLPMLQGCVTVIKVPPLRVRPSDTQSWVDFLLLKLAKAGRGPIKNVIQPGMRRRDVRYVVRPEVYRKLQAYQFPNNLVELKSTLERAVQQSTGLELTLESFWFASQEKSRYRIDLLTQFPLLRTFVRSTFWPEVFNMRIVAPVYAAVVALLFLGPQDRDHNFALNLFWCWWWPGIFIVYPFLGRIWCSFCPFMIYGELTQRLRTSMGAKLRKWPRESIETWGPWFLYTLFFGILIWEECWHLNQTAALSAWLLLLITAGAVICSSLFERRLWCRYLCPIGGMNGLFAKLSITEIRARKGVCAGNCNTYHCYKGGPAEPPQGLETNGCPLYSHPAQLVDNRHCVACMECVKACPHGSVQINLRPPGADVWQEHEGNMPEVALMFMLMGAVYLHCLPDLCTQFGIDSAGITTSLPLHMLVSGVFLAAPGLLVWAADTAVCMTSGPPSPSPPSSMTTPEAAIFQASSLALPTQESVPFVNLAYGWLPWVWAATLAFYIESFMGEAGRVLQVAAVTAGLDGSHVPKLVVVEPVISFVQFVLLLGGLGVGGVTTWHLGKQPNARVLTQWALMTLATIELGLLIIRADWNLPLVS